MLHSFSSKCALHADVQTFQNILSNTSKHFEMFCHNHSLQFWWLLISFRLWPKAPDGGMAFLFLLLSTGRGPGCCRPHVPQHKEHLGVSLKRQHDGCPGTDTWILLSPWIFNKPQPHWLWWVGIRYAGFPVRPMGSPQSQNDGDGFTCWVKESKLKHSRWTSAQTSK